MAQKPQTSQTPPAPPLRARDMSQFVKAWVDDTARDASAPQGGMLIAMLMEGAADDDAKSEVVPTRQLLTRELREDERELIERRQASLARSKRSFDDIAPTSTFSSILAKIANC